MATNLLFRSSQPATYLPIRLGWSLLPKRRYSSILAKNLGEIYNKNTLGTMRLQGIFLYRSLYAAVTAGSANPAAYFCVFEICMQTNNAA